MSLSIGTSLGAQAWPLAHEASSLVHEPDASDDVVVAFVPGELRSPLAATPLWDSSGEPPVDNAGGGRGYPIATTVTPARATRADVDSFVEEIDEKLNSIGDDAQLANVDMQNWLQKQQQNLQMLSSISKMLSDTAMAVIRKIGG